MRSGGAAHDGRERSAGHEEGRSRAMDAVRVGERCSDQQVGPAVAGDVAHAGDALPGAVATGLVLQHGPGGAERREAHVARGPVPIDDIRRAGPGARGQERPAGEAADQEVVEAVAVLVARGGHGPARGVAAGAGDPIPAVLSGARVDRGAALPCARDDERATLAAAEVGRSDDDVAMAVAVDVGGARDGRAEADAEEALAGRARQPERPRADDRRSRAPEVAEVHRRARAAAEHDDRTAGAELAAAWHVMGIAEDDVGQAVAVEVAGTGDRRAALDVRPARRTKPPPPSRSTSTIPPCRRP